MLLGCDEESGDPWLRICGDAPLIYLPYRLIFLWVLVKEFHLNFPNRDL